MKTKFTPSYIGLALLFLFAFSKNLDGQKSKELIRTFIEQSAKEQQLSKIDLQDWIITSQHTSSLSNYTHIYCQQRYQGIEIQSAHLNLHLNPDNHLYKINNNFIAGIEQKINTKSPKIDAQEALKVGFNELGLTLRSPLNIVASRDGKEQTILFSNEEISDHEIPTKLVYKPMRDGSLRLVWNIYIHPKTQTSAWDIQVDVENGSILSKVDRVSKCSFDHLPADKHVSNLPTTNLTASQSALVQGGYAVFDLPFTDPLDGGGNLVLVTDPDVASASPYGWHDTDGDSPADFTTTRGNNIDAYNDVDGNKYRPDGGSTLNFNFPFDLANTVDQNLDAAITNAFYVTNVVHDVFYQYGFDEASGNFQLNNYGKGGDDNDPLLIKLQSTSSACSAYYYTNLDGSNPYMELNNCEGRDGGFNNTTIVHEYTHGLSSRLTGGAGSFDWLQGNIESRGLSEGYSDWYAMMLTMKPDDIPTTERLYGAWFYNNNDFEGYRWKPYTTDFNENNLTYELRVEEYSENKIHRLGSIWCTALWEVTWNLLDTYGFDEDLYEGTGGNNIALALVTESFKLIGEEKPGFVEARDAIFEADAILYNSKHSCLLWEAFAKRGLGILAEQGSSDDINDGMHDFTVPSEPPSSIAAGTSFNFTNLIGNNTINDLSVEGILYLNELAASGSSSNPQAEAPTKLYHLNTTDCDLTSTDITVESGGKIEMGEFDNSSMSAQLHVGSGSTLHIKSGGRLRLVTGSQVIIEDGGKLIIDAGAAIDLWWGNSTIHIQQNGELVVNGDFSFSGSGFFQFDNNHILTLNEGLTINGQGDRFIQLNEGATLNIGDKFLNLRYGDIAYASGAKIRMGSGSSCDLFAVNFIDNSGSAIALEINDPDELKMLYCDFENFFAGIDITNINTPSHTHLFNLDFKNCITGIQIKNGSTFDIHSSTFVAGKQGHTAILASDLEKVSLYGSSISGYPDYAAFELQNIPNVYSFSNAFRNNNMSVKIEQVNNFYMGGGIIELTQSLQTNGPRLGIYAPKYVDGQTGQYNHSNITLTRNARIKNCDIGILVTKGGYIDGSSDLYGIVKLDCAKLINNGVGIQGKDITLKIDPLENCNCNDPDLIQANSFIKVDGSSQKYFDICYRDVQVDNNLISAPHNFWSENILDQITDYKLRNANFVGSCNTQDFISIDNSNPVLVEPTRCAIAQIPKEDDRDRTRNSDENDKDEVNFQLEVFPNPTHDHFQIKTTQGYYKLKVYNAIGYLVLEDHNFMGYKSIDASNWAKGIYLIEVINPTSMEKSIFRLSIQ